MTEHTTRVQCPHRDLLVMYGDMNDRTRSAVREVLEPMLWIIPPWCRSLHICIGEMRGDDMACCTIDDEYRQASIKLSTEWMTTDEEQQRRYLCHELVHIILEPVGGFGRRLLDAMGEQLDTAAFKLLDSEWVRTVEMVTNDIDRTLSMIDDQAVDVRRLR